MKKLSICLIFLTIFVFAGCNPPHDEHNHMHEETNSTRLIFYKAELKAEPAAIKPNEPVKFTISVKNENGEMLKDFDIVHEKAMHVLIVSEDLAEFYHEHPTMQSDGSMTLDFTFKNGGRYYLFADYKPKDGNQTVDRLNVEFDGNERPKEELKADAKFEKTVDGLRVEMFPDFDLISGKPIMLNFRVYDATTNQPVTDLENYLGEKAHFVIISKDLKDFVHAHPMSPDNMKAEKTSDSEKLTANANPPTVSAHVSFPNNGIYKIWAQFQRAGKVITVPFVVDVKQGKEEKTLTTAKIPEGYFKIVVSRDGFTPNEVSLSKDKPVKLAFLRIDEENCGDEIVFKDYNIKKKLPVGEVVTVEIEKVKGNEINFACGMDMLKGKIVVQ